MDTFANILASEDAKKVLLHPKNLFYLFYQPILQFTQYSSFYIYIQFIKII